MMTPNIGRKSERKERSRRRIVVTLLIVSVFFIGLSPFLAPIRVMLETSTTMLANRVFSQLASSAAEKLLFSADYHFSQEHYRKTIELCDKLIVTYEHQLTPERRRRVHAMLGLAYGEIGQRDKELQVYERMIPLDPAYAHFLKGVALEDRGDFRQAKSELNLALEAERTSLPLDETSHRLTQTTLEKIVSILSQQQEK